MRYAIYFTPVQGDPLARAAAAWLGRDAFTGLASDPVGDASISVGEIAFHTALPRRYGFHATIVAPFRAADSVSATGIADALASFCAQMEPFDLPLRIGRIGSFFALVPDADQAQVNALAHDAVHAFDLLRAPLSDAEIARRDPDTLTPRQLWLLKRWGYPYVIDEFRFHMTLTGPIPQPLRGAMEAALRTHFQHHLDRPVPIDGLAVFVEPAPGAPFEVMTRIPFAPSLHRKSA